MDNGKLLNPSVEFEIIKVKGNDVTPQSVFVASEVPYTIIINGEEKDMELATLLCTPGYLKELAYGFLFTSGIIHTQEDAVDFTLDRQKWIGYLRLTRPPDMKLLSKRIYTSGCGKGVMYSSYMELALRYPLDNKIRFEKEDIHNGMHFLLQCSALYKETHSVHTVALGRAGEVPHIVIDDIGRHNALDKVIGRALLEEEAFSESILFCTGRVSSEILHKAKRCEIPVIVSRGGPTHQAVLRARAMGITLAGYVRASGFSIFSHPERIVG